MLKDQIFPHKELTINIVAPDEYALCKWLHCKYNGSFRFIVKDDSGNIVMDVNPICRGHLIPAFIEAFEVAT